ncbi:MAG: plastocyanin/azurin family copper-binding protein [Actinomycetota bacterium]|jgi:plastocyanin
MRRATRPLTAVFIAVLALGACGGGGGGDDKADDARPASSSEEPRSGEAPVRITNFEFKPKKVVVKPGTKVTWTNEDTNIHDVKDTSPLGTPVSEEMSKGDTFSITYAQPGSYSYICGIHPYMIGTVEVVP